MPDVAVLRWDRVPRDEHGKIADEVLWPPDIAVEIISPGQSIAEATRDREWFVAHGTTLAQLVIPTGERVRLFLPGQPWRELRGDDVLDFDAVIPGARLSVREVFAALDAD